MSMNGTQNPKFTDGMTKQSFKDETDINKILKRAQKTGTISHLNRFEARYGDFANFDFFEAQLNLARGGEIFAELPMELRKEFNQNPADFFQYVNDPANKDRLGELLPALAAPGQQNAPFSGNLPADEAMALAKKEIAEIPDNTPEAPPAAPEGPPAAEPAAPVPTT